MKYEIKSHDLADENTEVRIVGSEGFKSDIVGFLEKNGANDLTDLPTHANVERIHRSNGFTNSGVHEVITIFENGATIE